MLVRETSSKHPGTGWDLGSPSGWRPENSEGRDSRERPAQVFDTSREGPSGYENLPPCRRQCLVTASERTDLRSLRGPSLEVGWQTETKEPPPGLPRSGGGNGAGPTDQNSNAGDRLRARRISNTLGVTAGRDRHKLLLVGAVVASRRSRLPYPDQQLSCSLTFRGRYGFDWQNRRPGSVSRLVGRPR